MNEYELSDIQALKKRAEDILNKTSEDQGQIFSESEALKLIHELDIYKIELEMQQHELNIAKDRFDFLTEEYNQLFGLYNRLVKKFSKSSNRLH